VNQIECSKFDCDGSLYEVCQALPNGKFLCVCRWGGNVGAELTLSDVEVLDLVNRKRG
jgi:hypothetical protein